MENTDEIFQKIDKGLIEASMEHLKEIHGEEFEQLSYDEQLEIIGLDRLAKILTDIFFRSKFGGNNNESQR